MSEKQQGCTIVNEHETKEYIGKKNIWGRGRGWLHEEVNESDIDVFEFEFSLLYFMNKIN
jgi:hypothetical protein